MRITSLALTALAVASCGGPRAMMNTNKPIAEFKLTQSTVRPQVFVFDAAQSRPTVGTLAKYKWKFGDEAAGAPATELTGSTAQHAYKAAGTFTVTLVVADDKDVDSDPVTKDVTVASVNTAGPMAVIAGPSSGMPAAMLTFDGSGSMPSGDIQNFAWDFGDGTTISGKDKTIVQHAFATAAIFRLTLTVTDSLAQSHTAELQVTVGDAGPLAVCSFTPLTPSIGTPVMFTGMNSTAPGGSTLQAYIWDFGDGTSNIPGNTTMGGAATHSYTAMGTFHPKLKVFDNHQPTARSHETTCPDVVVGAAALCNGQYSWSGTSGNPFCSVSATTVTITQTANGQMTIVEPYGASTITYSGTWTGSMFNLTGSYMGSSGETYDVTIHGTFSGCTQWTGTYASIDDLVGIQCNVNMTANKL